MRIKPEPAAVLGLATVVALLIMAVGASVAFGFSEFKMEAGTTFTGEGSRATLESTGKNFITCEKSKSSGTIESNLLWHLTVAYEGKCEVKGTANGACENVTTKELSVAPSTIVGGSGRGLLFMPVSGTIIAVVKCVAFGAEIIEVAGGVICENPKLKVLSTTGEVVCAQSSAGVQDFTEDEVGGSFLKCELTANALFTKEKDSLAATLKMTYSKAVEQT